mgnify:CR=1 FL=1
MYTTVKESRNGKYTITCSKLPVCYNDFKIKVFKSNEDVVLLSLTCAYDTSCLSSASSLKIIEAIYYTDELRPFHGSSNPIVNDNLLYEDIMNVLFTHAKSV